MTSPKTPLVSIVTPTIVGREQELMRCAERVIDLDWPAVQHVIVSDRTGFEAAFYDQWEKIVTPVSLAAWNEPDADPNWRRDLTFVQINEAWRTDAAERSIGSIPWYVGSLLALGEFIGFCGDDDELLPQHARRHVETMQATEADFTVSSVQFRAGGADAMVIGGQFGHGSMDSDGIMCRAETLRAANWSVSGEPGLEAAGDYRLVRDWLNAGKLGVIISEVTAIHNDGWLVGKTGRPDRPR